MADNTLAAALMMGQNQQPRFDPYSRTRRLAEMLMQRGATEEPITHPLQGVSRMLQQGLGGFLAGKADADETDRRQKSSEALLDYAGVPVAQRAAMKDLDPQTTAAIAIQLIGQKQAMTSATNTFNAKPPIGGADPGSGLGGISSGPLPPAGAPAPDQATFLQNMSPNARAASAQTGIDPRVVLAQTALETRYGKEMAGNNFFGVKGPGQTLNTMEADASGKLVPTQDSFRTYPDAAASTQGYVDVMKQPNMAGVLQQPGMTGQIAALGKSGYATDPQYAQKVGAIASQLSPLDPTDPQSAFVQGRPGLAGAPGFSPSPVPAQAVPGGLPQMPPQQVAQAPGAPPVTVQATPPAAVTTLPEVSPQALDLQKQARAAAASNTPAGMAEANRLMDEAHKAQSAHAIKLAETKDARAYAQQTEAQKTAQANAEHDRRQAAEAANKPLTVDQAKQGGYYSRMRDAAGTLDQFEAGGKPPSLGSTLTKNIPGVGAMTQGPALQAYNAAKLDWISSQLRSETGANMPASEVAEMERRYFPQPGEGPEIIKQKAQARAVAEEAMKQGAGPNYKHVPKPALPLPGGPRGVQPGHVEDGYRFKGGNPGDPNSWEKAQ